MEAESEHARMARENAEWVKANLPCAMCEHPRLRHAGCGDGHHQGSPHDECCDEDDCSCADFILPDTHDRWAYSQCACGHNRECNEIGVRACSECEPGIGYVFRERRGLVERQGLDLNRYVLEKVLPGAAELCEEGKQREIALERDKPAAEGPRCFMLAEVRGLPPRLINGVWQEPRGWYRTVDLLPHMTQTLMGRSEAQIRFAYAMALQKCRVAKSHREALKMANGNAIRFVFVGGGIEAAS